MKTPRRMNRQELLDYFSNLIENRDRSIAVLEDSVEALRAQVDLLRRGANEERWEQETLVKSLRGETNGLRKELAQAQSALYTLINKLPLGN